MTTEHVSVPREVFDTAIAELRHLGSYSALYAADEIEAILSRATPSDVGDGPLSLRLRAGIECAPWVIDAVRKLEVQIKSSAPRVVSDYADEQFGCLLDVLCGLNKKDTLVNAGHGWDNGRSWTGEEIYQLALTTQITLRAALESLPAVRVPDPVTLKDVCDLNIETASPSSYEKGWNDCRNAVLELNPNDAKGEA